jgi:hypothetical protein
MFKTVFGSNPGITVVFKDRSEVTFEKCWGQLWLNENDSSSGMVQIGYWAPGADADGETWVTVAVFPPDSYLCITGLP